MSENLMSFLNYHTGKKEGLGKFQPEQRFPNERLLEGKWSEQLKNLLANKGSISRILRKQYEETVSFHLFY